MHAHRLFLPLLVVILHFAHVLDAQEPVELAPGEYIVSEWIVWDDAWFGEGAVSSPVDPDAEMNEENLPEPATTDEGLEPDADLLEEATEETQDADLAQQLEKAVEKLLDLHQTEMPYEAHVAALKEQRELIVKLSEQRTVLIQGKNNRNESSCDCQDCDCEDCRNGVCDCGSCDCAQHTLAASSGETSSCDCPECDGECTGENCECGKKTGCTGDADCTCANCAGESKCQCDACDCDDCGSGECSCESCDCGKQVECTGEEECECATCQGSATCSCESCDCNPCGDNCECDDCDCGKSAPDMDSRLKQIADRLEALDRKLQSLDQDND